jgi:phosphoserine phosphatase
MTTDTNALHERKERLYSELQEISRAIAGSINELKERREKRNALTQAAQDAKTQRKELSRIIKEKISVVKDLRKKLPDKPGTTPSQSSRGGREREERVTPGKLREEIQRLETKLETSAMDFTEEQKLTKILKEKKAQLAKMGGENDLERDVRSRSKEIDKLKRESDVAHEEVTRTARESQEHHEAILALSKKIEELKERETKLRDEYQKIKDELGTHSEVLPEKKPRGTKGKRGETSSLASSQPSAEDKATIKEKAAEVEEKIKTGKKLTTEDLLALQAHK